MLRKLHVLCLLTFLPIAANATAISSVGTTNCGGNLTISLLGDASFSCSGSLALTGGGIISNSLISIVSNGDLFLDNLTLDAPNITFSSLSGTLTIGSGVIANASSVTLSAPNVVQNGIINTQGPSVSIMLITTPAINPLLTSNPGAGLISIGGGVDLGRPTLSPTIGPITNSPVVGGSIFITDPNTSLVDANSGINNPLASIAAVPEPSTYLLMLLGVLGLVSIRRKLT
jgi:PEP-CTERM motif